MVNLEGQSVRERMGGLSFKEFEDKFFPHPNPYTLITRDDWDMNSTDVDPVIGQLWDAYVDEAVRCSSDTEEEGLVRQMDLLYEREEAEFNRIHQKSIAAAALCPVDEVPTYPPEVIKGEVFQKKQHLSVKDVVELLSSGGQRDYLVRCPDGQRVELTEDLVRGKHLVICCFFVPLLAHSPHAALCHALIEAYTSLDLEMVIVAKMRSQLDSEEQLEAFQQFISAFDCLAIPFEDSLSRDNICLTLGMTYPDSTSCYTPASMSGLFSAGLVIDPDQMVLQTDVGFFLHHGVSSFPFTNKKLEELTFEDHGMRLRMDPYYIPPYFAWLGPEKLLSHPVALRDPISLKELLGSHLFAELRDSDDRVICGSDLCKKRCVALYLCVSGSLLHRLNETLQECLLRNFEIEIVVICLFSLFTGSRFQEGVHQALRKLNVPSWWVLQPAYELTRKLWRLVDWDLDDKLIFVEDGGKSWELDGKGVLDNFGVEGYPFTRKAITEQKLSALCSLTLDALMEPFRAAGMSLIRNKQYDEKGLSGLKGKRVLVCFAFLDSRALTYNFFVPLLDSYKDIQAAGGEVLYILLSNRPGDYSDEEIVSMPWLRPPLNPPVGASVAEQLYVRYGYGLQAPRILAFREDGMICSKNAHHHLSSGGGVPDHLFDDNQQCLREEIHKEVRASLH